VSMHACIIDKRKETTLLLVLAKANLTHHRHVAVNDKMEKMDYISNNNHCRDK